MAKKISRVLASKRDYILRPFALADHSHEFYPPAVADIAARDAITGDQRYEGAIVYVEADQTTYQLRGGSSNADWVTLVSAGGFSSHTQLADIGTNTHAQIDTHIADATIHFTMASISITESQISDLQSYALASHDHAGVYLGVNDAAASADALSTTGADVDVSGAAPPVAGQILTAVDATSATWQTPASAGVGDILQIGTQVDTRVAYFTADKNLSGDDNFTWDDATQLLTIAGGSPEIRIQDTNNPGTTMTASLSFWDSTGVAAEIRMDGTGDLRIENADGEIRFDTGTSDVVVTGNGDLIVGNDLTVTGYLVGYGGSPADGATLQWVAGNSRAEFVLGAVTASGTPVDNQIAVFNAAAIIEGDANFTWDGANFIAGDLFWDGSVDQLNIGGGDLSSPGIEIDGSATATPFINLAQAGVVRAVYRFNDASDRLEVSSTSDNIELRPGNVDTYTFTQAAFTAGNYVFDIDQVLGAGQDNYVLTYDNASGTISFEVAAMGGGSIGGSITNNQVAIGASTADEIEGTAEWVWDSTQSIMNLGQSTQVYVIAHTVDTQGALISGGLNGAAGANIILYGGSHASLAGDMVFRNNVTAWMSWDESAGQLEISTGVGSKTLALTIASSQLITIADGLEHNGNLGFYGTTALAQPSSTGETLGFTAGTGVGINDDSTFTGNSGATAYRISDIVKHLKNLGLIAS